ncbi:hypothetical protein FJZ18_02575 [Candidatus Pacearchaeota archaeon]|nr:hypothetical protein [Candidatus Pacearchaeota archaeon]
MAKLSRQTRQKHLLQEELDKFTSFFTGEELFEKARKKDSKLGLATVYRFLKDLREKRVLHAYSCNRQMLHSTEEGGHCHFICEQCGKTEHFHLNKIDFLKQGIKGDVCHFQLDVHGICEACKKHMV